MKALILAGGLGTRLYPVTQKIPKALVEVSGQAIIEHQIELCKKYGILDFVIAIGEKGEQIQRQLGDGKKFGVKIEYSIEFEPLGTGGALLNARKFFDQKFIAFHGDMLMELNMSDLIGFHNKKGGIATMTIMESTHPLDCDMVELNEEGRITKMLGKPKNESFENNANAGVYVFESKVFSYKLEKKQPHLDNDLMKELIEKDKVFAFKLRKGEFVEDIGTHERLERANNGMKTK